jgi:hypothetical protein
MINVSEVFCKSCSLCSLCACCRNENPEVHCDHENATPFIRADVFYHGKCLCETGSNADCVYKYAEDKVISIEIKDQPENSIDYDVLVSKIVNCYKNACSKNLKLIMFILQLSNKKNSSAGKYQLLGACKYGLKMNKINTDKNGILYSREEPFKTLKVRFDIVKCKDFDETYFNAIAI